MIIVFGSINMDFNISLGHFPHPGETVLCPLYETSAGGKGANQALAAARSGAKTALVGKIGDDVSGQSILAGLRRNEVMTSGVATSDFSPTGMAVVMKNPKGENQIVVASGANLEVSASQVPDEILRPGNILLMQMEVPELENITLMERAKKLGAMVMLNLAPAVKISQKALNLVDILIVNEVEARMIADVAGIPPEQKDLVAVAKALSKAGDLDCIVTLGADGAVAATKTGETLRVPSLAIENVVDTTGAGDCFCGTLAAGLHARLALGSALRRASVAASLSCTRKGAQDSYPYPDEIDGALETFPQVQVG